MKIQNIINEEIFKLHKNEGVGDKYLANKYPTKLPDEGDKFQSDYERNLKTKKQNISNKNGEIIGEVIFNERSYGYIFKNPRTLVDFEKDVRAISDINGDLYVLQLDIPAYHSAMLDFIEDKNIVNTIGDAYSPQRNITWHRINNTDSFCYSISFQTYALNYSEDTEKRIEMLRRKHPQFEFINDYCGDLDYYDGGD